MARDLVVIGGSAGALEPLSNVLQGLGSDFDGAILVALHTSADSSGALPEILSRATSLPVAYARDGETIERGRVYLAPPDHHLRVQVGRVSVMQGPRENGFRPAIDPLFRSAALNYGSRVIGIVLSGAMDDGTFGLSAIKEAGGLAIVQHPYEATTPSMPLSAIQNVEVDYIVRAREITQILHREISSEEEPIAGLTPSAQAVPDETELRDVALNGTNPDELSITQGPPSIYSCPECGGALWEVHQGKNFRFRCHTGHGFTAESLLSEQKARLEHALWTAVRVLQERSALHRQLAHRSELRGMETAVQQFTERATLELQQAGLLRDFLDRDVPQRHPLPDQLASGDPETR